MKRMIMALMLSCMVLGFAAPLFAVTDGDVLVGQDVVLRIRFAAGGYTVQERAESVMLRINELLGAQPFDPNDVKVVQKNKEWVVTIGNALIITADSATAKYNGSTPQQLATMWAKNLRIAIPKAKNPSVG